MAENTEPLSYTYDDVVVAANSLFKELYHNKMANPCLTAYGGALPRQIQDCFCQAYVISFDRADERMQLLLTAYDQLMADCKIG